MELLILLAERQGQLVTREEIIKRLWGDNVYVDTRQGINTAIRKIRLALKDDPDDPRVLLTVVGKGYRLVAPITTIGPAGDAPKPDPEPDRTSVAAAKAPITGLGSQGPATSSTSTIVDPGLARALFLVIQAGYLTLYAFVFAHLAQIRAMRLPAGTSAFTLIAGLVGAALHLYLIAAVAFNYPGSGRLFRQIFPGVVAIDVLWAASPLFLFERWGEVTLLCVAALAFLPFSQRTLMCSAYGGLRNLSE